MKDAQGWGGGSYVKNINENAWESPSGPAISILSPGGRVRVSDGGMLDQESGV